MVFRDIRVTLAALSVGIIDLLVEWSSQLKML